MRLAGTISTLTIALGFAAPALAQTRDDILRCRSIEEDAPRLRCYDAIRLSTAAPRSKYEPVPLDELKTYALTYRGRLVEAEGWLVPAGGIASLGVDADDERPLPVEIETLPRREREALLEACEAGCQATVQGRVNPINFTTGIVAEKVIVR